MMKNDVHTFLATAITAVDSGMPADEVQYGILEPANCSPKLAQLLTMVAFEVTR